MFPGTQTARIIAGALLALVAVVSIWLIYNAITAKPKAEARLGRNTTEAAQQSGKDAVNTVGTAGEREAATNDLSRTNEKDIRDAEGSTAPVATPVRDAGLRSLCKRRAYSGRPECVQFADP